MDEVYESYPDELFDEANRLEDEYDCAGQDVCLPVPDPEEFETYTFVNTVAKIDAAVSSLAGAFAIAIDLEGANLGRHGRIATLQICGSDRGHVYIIDIAKLGNSAFTPGLRALLEASEVRKIFFDCRSDTAALAYQYSIAIPASAVVDLQLLDVAAAAASGRTLSRLGGLGWLFDHTSHAGMSRAEQTRMSRVRAAAQALYAPEHGGSNNVWFQRPLVPELLEYATDVRYIHALWYSLAEAALGPNDDVLAALQRATSRRCAEGLKFGFDGSGHASLRVLVDPVLMSELAKAWGKGVARHEWKGSHGVDYDNKRRHGGCGRGGRDVAGYSRGSESKEATGGGVYSSGTSYRDGDSSGGRSSTRSAGSTGGGVYSSGTSYSAGSASGGVYSSGTSLGSAGGFGGGVGGSGSSSRRAEGTGGGVYSSGTSLGSAWGVGGGVGGSGSSSHRAGGMGSVATSRQTGGPDSGVYSSGTSLGSAGGVGGGVYGSSAIFRSAGGTGGEACCKQ